MKILFAVFGFLLTPLFAALILPSSTEIKASGMSPIDYADAHFGTYASSAGLLFLSMICIVYLLMASRHKHAMRATLRFFREADKKLCVKK